MQTRNARIIGAGSALVGCCLLVIALAFAGCGSPAVEPPASVPPDAGPPDADATACAPGELTRDDGSCQPAGLPPDMPCPPGELPLTNGTCQKAGVPPSACAEGFVPDGMDGCEPILPAEPCPAGQMAVPGETTCREVAPCGSGTWRDIPVEANTEFVDQAYAGGNSDGTQADPWTSIQQAIDAAENGAIVAVAAGAYAEDVVIEDKAVRLWGRCPGMVEVAAAGVAMPGVNVVGGAASGTEIRGASITGAKAGIRMSGASDVVIEEVWVHDAGEYGVVVVNSSSPTSVVLRGSLIEQSHTAGVLVVGSDATIEGSVVRSTQHDAGEVRGYGIAIQDNPSPKARANVTVRGSLVEQNHDASVLVVGSDATFEATVIRATQLDNQGVVGDGIHLQDNPGTKERANVTVRASLVEQNPSAGVFVQGSDATIEATVIRANQLNDQGTEGYGIAVQDNGATKARSNVTVRASLVEQNHSAGVLVYDSAATIEATVIRKNQLDGEGLRGFGVAIQEYPGATERANVIVRACLIEQNHEAGVFIAGSDATIEASVIRATADGYGVFAGDDFKANERANVAVRACLVEQNHEAGVFIAGSDAMIEASVIRATQLEQQGSRGYGVAIQEDPETMARADVTVRACLVEQNRSAGVFILSSDGTIEATAVRDTASRDDGSYGDGIFVEDSTVTIEDVEVTRNARAGVSNFSGQVTVIGGIFTCNALDLDYETTNDTPGSFDGSAGWQCSSRDTSDCTVLGECKAVTSGLDAPPPLPPVEPL